jgi:hypothetical protein
LFTDTGAPVQNATVQAYLVTGGGTDAGTGSALTSSTTTDVNGVWKFTALADPGAGNWYDVKIINGNQVRWHYGNIQSAIALVTLPASYTIGAGQTWDFSAATTKVADPIITGQVVSGTGTQTLPTVTGNTGKWRFYKATSSSMTITPASGEALWAPGATAASAANATYSSPAGESTGWYCNGTNWICI